MATARRWAEACAILALAGGGSVGLSQVAGRIESKIGQEKAVLRHLADDEELKLPLSELLAHGKMLFGARWTSQDGAGRPRVKGNGRVLADRSKPLTGARAFNRVSGPDANSCAGCHNSPYGIPGGSGDFAGSAFIGAYRFDYLTFDSSDSVPTRGSRDEAGKPVTLQSAGNLRRATGMFGSGYVEMLARQMTAELQNIRSRLRPGESARLVTKGVFFGTLARSRDGLWDTSRTEGLPESSLITATSLDPPSLIVRPWRQSGTSVSLRELVTDSFDQHLGVQATERYGENNDLDDDGYRNEVTRADVTATAIYLATLPAPGRVIPTDPQVEAAVLAGERRFDGIGCATCHIPRLPLDDRGWIFEEPNPYNPMTNLRRGEAKSLKLDLNSAQLPAPRLAAASDGVVWTPAYTDLKLHDITTGATDPFTEPLDLNIGSWSVDFSKGNRKFLTRRLWGCGNQPPYFHHGLFTTLREAVLAHSGEALAVRRRFEQLPRTEQDEVIEFLKSLQVLPPGTQRLAVDEQYRPRVWPPNSSGGAR